MTGIRQMGKEILLKGGCWHNKVLIVSGGMKHLYVARPTNLALLNDDLAPLSSSIAKDIYVPSRYEGYAPGSNRVLPIWIQET
jgi:hypothetical protein